MIDKDSVTASLKNNLGAGKDDLTSIQHTFLEMIKAHPDDWNYENKKLVLNGILAFAGEIFGKIYGYREFDLVMGRAFPNAETFRGISEEEGCNIYE